MKKTERRSKIVCTLGPAVGNLDAIVELIEAGMDVARINFSHGTHEAHRQVIHWIREASKITHKAVAILGDLQGPKIRTGTLLDADNKKISTMKIEAGQTLYFRGGEGLNKAPGRGTKESPITISYARLAQDLRAQDWVLFDDGLIRMQVEVTDPINNVVQLKVINGLYLGENKGVNMPGAKLSTLGITEKDWEDIQFATEEGVDFLALSFVRSAREVKSLKSFIAQRNFGIQVVSKIEKAEAIDNIDEILFWSDAIMVARGDLGVEIGNEKVPTVQKLLIQKARFAGKPVITATQMLMSMVSNPSPSRAEASDVANAVFDGSDALMLSNETATGSFPFESVKTMASIILSAEDLSGQNYISMANRGPDDYQKDHSVRLPVSEAIEAAAKMLSKNLNARCLACLTRSGQAARLLAKYRPLVPIYAFAESEKVRNQLALSWGVYVIPWAEMPSLDYQVFDELLNELTRLGHVAPGDLAVMTAGIPTSLKVGTTNTVVVKECTRSVS